MHSTQSEALDRLFDRWEMLEYDDPQLAVGYIYDPPGFLWLGPCGGSVRWLWRLSCTIAAGRVFAACRYFGGF